MIPTIHGKPMLPLQAGCSLSNNLALIPHNLPAKQCRVRAGEEGGWFGWRHKKVVSSQAGTTVGI